MHGTNETEADPRANRIDPVLRQQLELVVGLAALLGWQVVHGAGSGEPGEG